MHEPNDAEFGVLSRNPSRKGGAYQVTNSFTSQEGD